MYSTGFQRDKPIILKRVRSNQIANPAAYEPWGFRDGVWAWGNPPTPILNGSFGEMSLRPPYGGYIIPGSTLADLHLSVSQWNTNTGWPYRVMQFRTRNFG